MNAKEKFYTNQRYFYVAGCIAAQLDGNNFQICQEKENRAESIKILVRED